jgi:hypothetical protein
VDLRLNLCNGKEVLKSVPDPKSFFGKAKKWPLFGKAKKSLCMLRLQSDNFSMHSCTLIGGILEVDDDAEQVLNPLYTLR